METKRRGCPPGGWPSQKAKKSAVAPSGPRTTAFALVDHGKGLWSVEMLTLKGDAVVDRRPLSSADTKATALHSLRLMAYKLYFMDQDPGMEAIASV